MKKIKKKTQSEKSLTPERVIKKNYRIIKELKISDNIKIESFSREKIKHIWLIIIKALKEKNILTTKHLEKIAEMGIF